MLYLTCDDVLHVAARAIGDVQVRDAGMIEAAVARPQAIVGGVPAYPDLVTQAAALTHSLVCNHGLVDGNKRLGLACLIVFLGINGRRLTMSNDDAYDLIYGMASGEVRELDQIARAIDAGSAYFDAASSSSSS